ncbi:MAG: hypothetical protein FWE96_08655 [Coriobacteriia bacterium]|nr:hypothetical protein [Coriobacteriia bacterium]
MIWLLLFVEEVFNAFSNIVFDSLFFSLTLALSLALVAAVFFALGAIKAKKTFFVSTKVGLIAAILLVFFAVFLLLFGLIGEPLIYEWFALSAQNYELRALLEILSFMFVFLPLIAFSVCLAVFLASIARQLSRGSYRLHPLFISETPQ